MSEGLRLAELIAALSLATDLGMGQPLEQGLRTCLIALEIGERIGLGSYDMSDVFYTALLRFLGCSADAHEAAQIAGGDEIAFRAAVAPVLGAPPREFASQVMPRIGAGSTPLRRLRLVAGMMTSGRERARAGLIAHCELGENLAQRLGLGSGVRESLAAAFEQWNGAGLPNGRTGEAIPLPARIVYVARDCEILHRVRGAEALVDAVRARRSQSYDPAIADVLLRDSASILVAANASSPWEEAMRLEPEPRPWIPESRLDSVLRTFADFADLKSPCTAGHSRDVAELAAAAARADGHTLRRAGLVHDLGRAAVPNGIWDKPGPLTGGEWERVRLHPYYTERILGHVAALRPLASLAGMHHERLDGSGYYRGSMRAEIPPSARILAAADAYQAMTQARPHRAALTAERAADELELMAASGRLDADAVTAVLNAAGHRRRPPKRPLPAGLSEREVEVLRLICHGGSKKEVASRLSISPSTVDHHVRHIYDKAGVRSRAAATLFALEHDLLT